MDTNRIALKRTRRGNPPSGVPSKTIKVEEKGKKFEKRSEEKEREILGSYKAGTDREDDKFLNEMMEEMQKEGGRPFGVDENVEYKSFLRAFTPRELMTPTVHNGLDLYYDDPDLAGIVPNSTGCARSEGFYLSPFEVKSRMRKADTDLDKIEVETTKEEPEFPSKKILFGKSRIHGMGIFANEHIKPEQMVMEFVAERIRLTVADEREKEYVRRGMNSTYFFRIDDDEVLDSTHMGNCARFINHSCVPNCYTKVRRVDGQERLFIYSKKTIQKGEELKYDYKFPFEEEKVKCICGAAKCKGTLN